MILATQFLNIAIAISFLSLAIGQVMAMVRLVLGPTPGDRVLALDTMVINALGLVIMLARAGLPFAFMRVQIPFAQTHGIRRDLNQFVVINVSNRLFQRHNDGRCQTYRFVST